MKPLFFLLGAIFICISSCTEKQPPAAEPDATPLSNKKTNSNDSILERNKAAALALEDGFNKHDADAALKNAATDVVDYGDGTTPPAKGIDTCKAFLREYFTAFPDMKGENLMTIAEGNHVVVIADWSGTSKGNFIGTKPTGKRFKIKDADIFTFNDQGQITEHRSVQAVQTIMSQIGARVKGKS